jgi:hypothetical protein
MVETLSLLPVFTHPHIWYKINRRPIPVASKILGDGVRNTFEEVATAVLEELIKEVEGKKRVCHDQYVGIISAACSMVGGDKRGDKNFDRKFVDDWDGNIKSRPNCVILILESPHKAELNLDPPQPAKGTTGRNIGDYLCEIDALKQYADYGLVLMNAIQYQCSLGLDPKCVRDKIFVECWKKGGAKDFERRLRETYKPGDVLLNCCTKGTDKRGKLVTNVIRNISKELKINRVIEGSHPSYWHSRSNLCKEKFIPIEL